MFLFLFYFNFLVCWYDWYIFFVFQFGNSHSLILELSSFCGMLSVLSVHWLSSLRLIYIPLIICSVCAWAHTKSKVDGSCFPLSPCTLFLRQGLSFRLELTSQPIWDNELMGSTCLCPPTPALLLHGPQYLAVDLDAWDLEFIYHSFQAGTFCREPPSQPSRYILCLHFP